MSDANQIATPMINNIKLSKFGTNSLLDIFLYISIIGGLQYATLTRPDIAYNVNKVCQFMSHPLESHQRAVKRILRYLKGTLKYGLELKAAPISSGPYSLIAFSDADWGVIRITGDQLLDIASILAQIQFLGA